MARKPVRPRSISFGGRHAISLSYGDGGWKNRAFSSILAGFKVAEKSVGYGAEYRSSNATWFRRPYTKNHPVFALHFSGIAPHIC